jgi:hypothetical protein
VRSESEPQRSTRHLTRPLPAVRDWSRNLIACDRRSSDTRLDLREPRRRGHVPRWMRQAHWNHQKRTLPSSARCARARMTCARPRCRRGSVARGQHGKRRRLARRDRGGRTRGGRAAIAADPSLATARLARSDEFFIAGIRAQIYAGDTARHAAAFAYDVGIARPPRGPRR